MSRVFFDKDFFQMSDRTVPVIAIDGPTASGKGTVAARVAEALGFHYLDSGALFRLAALACLEKGVDLTDEQACAELAGAMNPVFEAGEILLDGRAVTQAIRAEQVGLAASKIAVLPAVRKALFELELRARRAPGLVADGRDMASVVFPDAALKVFLTASAEARAMRRYKQLIEKGVSANLSNLTRDLQERDRRDRERPVSPCVPAPDALVLDSSDLSIEATVGQVLSWWQARVG